MSSVSVAICTFLNPIQNLKGEKDKANRQSRSYQTEQSHHGRTRPINPPNQATTDDQKQKGRAKRKPDVRLLCTVAKIACHVRALTNMRLRRPRQDILRCSSGSTASTASSPRRATW